MEALQAIFTRRSVRSFQDRPVPEETIKLILSAGMSGPTCVNARQWSFIVVRDRAMLGRMADANGRPAQPLRGAAFAVLVCGDLKRAFQPAPDYWIIDCSIAAQNMVIAAHALGVGSVWLGTWPQTARVEAQRELFRLPETVTPHSILAFGYPEDDSFPERNLYEPDRVHYEKW